MQITIGYKIGIHIQLSTDHSGKIVVPVNAQASPGQSGMACVEFFGRLFKDETFYFFHLLSEFFGQVNVDIFCVNNQYVN